MNSATLYRKYRPTTFSKVYGQSVIVRTLTNQILQNSISHAYLFCGPRGTGKTSIAKIFSRAINCKSPIGADPCGQCECCKLSLDNNNIDIVEIDAASNNGVDSIRTLIEECRYRPMNGKFKVYIIDEVHMLTNSAFNALLKTLEEPTGNVVFILATTEPHKVPATISSRCQVFNFKLLTEDEIVAAISNVLIAEDVKWESDETLRHIARLSNGGLRDALSITDQLINYSTNRFITNNDILDVCGEVENITIDNMISSILNHQPGVLLSIARKLENDGKPLQAIVTSLYNEIKKQYLKNNDKNFQIYINILADLSEKIKYNNRIVFETELINLCNLPIIQNNSIINNFEKHMRITTELYDF